MTPVLWSRRALVVMVTSSVVGLIAMILASYGASGEEALADQVRWLNLAVIGSMITGAGQASLLIRGRRLVALRRDDLTARLAVPAQANAVSVAPSVAVAPGERVRVADGTWHHAGHCVLVRDKDVEPVDDISSLAACAICGAA